MFDPATRNWLRVVGPFLGLSLVFAVAQGVFVLWLHREGGKNDVAPLVLPAHYLLQKPSAAASTMPA